jgi:phage gp45-like
LNDLVGKLTGVADDLTELQFMVDTKAISKAAGTKQLNALVKQFDVLSAQADALTGNAGISSSGLSGLKTDTSANVTNIYVTGAIDKEGTARTIYDVMNNSFYRGTGGAGNLVGITP